MSSVSWANALAEVEADTQVFAGDKVKVHLLPN
jgi:molybdopterin biosynthesis enzyme